MKNINVGAMEISRYRFHFTSPSHGKWRAQVFIEGEVGPIGLVQFPDGNIAEFPTKAKLVKYLRYAYAGVE
jgi:hypothetical protein